MTISVGPKTRVITLTGRAPVRIVEADWPLIARASDHDGYVASQADRTWTLRVRQHDDGRTIVYGVYSTSWQGERDEAAGELLDAGEDIPAAIHRVAESCGCERLVAACIADLPAEVLV